MKVYSAPKSGLTDKQREDARNQAARLIEQAIADWFEWMQDPSIPLTTRLAIRGERVRLTNARDLLAGYAVYEE